MQRKVKFGIYSDFRSGQTGHECEYRIYFLIYEIAQQSLIQDRHKEERANPPTGDLFFHVYSSLIETQCYVAHGSTYLRYPFRFSTYHFTVTPAHPVLAVDIADEPFNKK